MRKVGLPDAIGAVAVLVALAWLPGAADPLTYIKLLFLIAGGLAIAPAVIFRWAKGGRPNWVAWVPCGAAMLIILWGLVSIVGSGAPIWNSLFGWWGRGDGFLAWTGAAFLLLGAATLSRQEVSRVVLWLLGGASAVAIIGLLQFMGVEIPAGTGNQVTGTMGNPNFAAGYFAIVAVLALGRALMAGATGYRIWGAGLFLILAFLAWQTKSQQGPVALAAGVVALGVAYALLYRGRWRSAALAGAGVVVLLGIGATVASVFQAGPLGDLWSDRTFNIRQQYWQSSIRIMQGLPVFGTGPDGFSRYVAEYRPESYVELLGPTLRVSAAHNIALQFGAVLGYVGLLMWLVLFVGTGVVLLRRIIQGPTYSIALTASVAGALVAYVVQGMVSIDMLPLLATGWVVCGLAVALAREPLPKPAPAEEPKTRKARASAATSSPSSAAKAEPLWTFAVGGLAGLVAAILVGGQIGLTNEIQTIDSQDKALGFISNPMTPCVLRVQVTQQVIQQLPAEISVPAALEATDLDRRCPPMIAFASDVLVQQQRFDEADTYTAQGVEIDPLFDLAWVLRARYYLGVGDLPAAELAAEEARRVQSLYPADARDPALVEALLNDLSLAKEATG